MKTSFDISRENESTSLLIAGELNIRSCSAFKVELSKLLKTPFVTISLKEVTALDVTATQLLYAFRKASGNNMVHVILPENVQVVGLLSRTGLIKLFE